MLFLVVRVGSQGIFKGNAPSVMKIPWEPTLTTKNSMVSP